MDSVVGWGHGDFILRTGRETQKNIYITNADISWCIQKFPNLPPGARTADGKALYH
jgi:hypothetical protein